MTGDADLVRVASWNVRDLSGDPMALEAVLRALDADVVCLQEAPRRPGGVRLRTAPLARTAALRHAVGGRRSGGTAVLVAAGTTVLAARAVRLPVAAWHHRRRGVAVVALRRGPVELAVASVHLPLTEPQRLEHAHLVHEVLLNGPPDAAATLARRGAVVVAGDFNETSDGVAWQLLTRLAADPDPAAAPTFPARSPDRRIDAILVGPGLEVLAYTDGGVADHLVRRASDHRPVLALLRAR